MSDKCALAFGEVLWDVYPEKKTLGGAALNFAAHFALKGGSARLISAVGDDTLGQQALCEIQRLSVDTRFVSVLPGRKTGRCDVTLDGNAVPKYDLIPDTAYDRIPAEGVDDTRCDVFYFGTLALREGRNTASLRQLLARISGLKFCDLNLRAPYYGRDVIRFCLENADIVKISLEELPEVLRALDMPCITDTPLQAEAALFSLARRFNNLRLILLTCGADGAAVLDCKAARMFRCNAVKTQVVSTVGAGDSFSAAFIYSLLNGKSLLSSLECGASTAAWVCSYPQAVPPSAQKK